MFYGELRRGELWQLGTLFMRERVVNTERTNAHNRRTIPARTQPAGVWEAGELHHSGSRGRDHLPARAVAPSLDA